MAFPTVNGSIAATANASGTTMNATMPSGIVAGELLLLLVACGGTGHDVSGWTEVTSGLSPSGGSVLAAWVKEAVGSDTAVLNPDGAGSQVAGMICMRIGGWSGVLSDVTGVSANQGITTAAPNPPSHTALYTRDNLWIAVGAGNGDPGSAPTNYTGFSSVDLASSASVMEQARRALNALTENPGAFGGTVGNPGTMTIVIPPPPITSLPPRRSRRYAHLLVR